MPPARAALSADALLDNRAFELGKDAQHLKRPCRSSAQIFIEAASYCSRPFAMAPHLREIMLVICPRAFMPRALITYCRVSTKAQGRSGLG